MTREGDVASAYEESLRAVGRIAPDIPNATLTSHWLLVGNNFDQGVLVVGQAVYGWIPDWEPGLAAIAEGRRTVLRDTREACAERDDPMNWIDGHRVENSPFWRTAHEVVDALEPATTPWFSRIAWANLYPVAPNDHKGNPEGPLRQVQTAPAADLLRAVVASLQPSVVLVLAGPYIWPFVEPLGLSVLARAEAPLTFAGRKDGVIWLTGMHPGGAQRRGWPARRYAELLVAAARGA